MKYANARVNNPQATSLGEISISADMIPKLVNTYPSTIRVGCMDLYIELEIFRRYFIDKSIITPIFARKIQLSSTGNVELTF